MHTISAAQSGQRLDRYLKQLFPNTPFVVIQKLIRSGQIRIDGKRAGPDTRLEEGETLRLPPSLTNPQTPSDKPTTPVFQASNQDIADLKSWIVHEDNQLMAINKPAGLASQAGPNITKSLDRLLAALYPKDPPKLTHRLDRETTGLILAAKTRTAAAFVAEQFREQTAPHKIYLALLSGHLTPKGKSTGWHHIRAALNKTRGAGGARSFVDEKEGADAHTSYQIIAHVSLPSGPATLVAARPHTGRMNQLRVHFAHIGHPILGDDKYGEKIVTKTPLHLHAVLLTVTHPKTQENITFTAPIPPHFTSHLPAAFPHNLLDLPAFLG